MASSTFGLTPESVRAHYFGHFDAFSTRSPQTVATVTEIIAEEAARMAGKLNLELIDASAITTDSDAYKACKRILRLQVAVRLVRVIPGLDSALAQTWEAEVEAWYADLAKGGASFIGDGATATGSFDADGPASHVTVYGLTPDDGDDMSSPVPFLRMDDEL